MTGAKDKFWMVIVEPKTNELMVDRYGNRKIKANVKLPRCLFSSEEKAEKVAEIMVERTGEIFYVLEATKRVRRKPQPIVTENM